ncbi:hypothetical protein AGMMS49944_21700 [Spirochaetia bacterium]|nr:hypothetical protein AGMMS49944_21700 [Spirochaetia bacterium]
MAIYHAKDNSFKLILGNHELFVEFLRDYLDIELLKDVRPEDIEDMSERFLPLFQDNQDSDTVKRINLKGMPPLFVIALLEHESRVNYRSSFKMLQYICLILDSYEKEVNRDHEGLSATRDFRYPPVLPIIFYDGSPAWTAEKNFFDRTALNEVFAKYIPKFEYILVDLNRYTQEDLVRFNDVLSLVMMIDKLETWDGVSLLSKLPPNYIGKMALKIPKELTKLITDVVTVLLDRFNYPEAEIRTVTDHLTDKEDQGMFDRLVEAANEKLRLTWEDGLGKGLEKGQNQVLELVKRGYTAEQIEAKLSHKTEGTKIGGSRDV